jgi:ABC-type Fe3+ transport system permease subunit
MRSPFALSLLVTLCALFAIAAWFHGSSLGWRYLLSGGDPGVFDTSVRDFPMETHAQEQARLRERRAFLSELRWSFRLSKLAATASLLGAILLAWRSRKQPWRRQLAVGLLASIALAVFVYVQFV